MIVNRTMIHFPDGERRRFNVRVAGVAVRDGHVLVCREDDDAYVMLPGGRVEIGENSHSALNREIAEELHCRGEVGRLLFTVENFYHLEDKEFHQIGLYYEIQLPESFPFHTDGNCLVTHDEGHELQFDWVAATPDALVQWNLVPNWLANRISDLPRQTEHLVIDERS